MADARFVPLMPDEALAPPRQSVIGPTDIVGYEIK